MGREQPERLVRTLADIEQGTDQPGNAISAGLMPTSV